MAGRATLLGFDIGKLRIPGGRRRALNVALIGTIALLVLALAAFTEPADETPQVRLSSGSAWLVSPTVAAVTLVDGASESIVAARRLDAAPNEEVSVTQSGTDAFVVNDTRGTVARIDGSTLQVQPGRQFADSLGSLELVAGPSALWVLDANRGQAFRVDPRSLATQFEASLAARPGSSQSIVDADGRLWVIDSDRGGLIWIDGTQRHEADEPPGNGSRLVLVRDRPVLADPTSGQLRSIDSDGDIGEPTCLDIQDGADAQLFGSRVDHVVYAAVSQTGTLLTAATDTDDCSKAPLTISNRSDVLGPPVSSDRFLFVPNLTTGSTVIVDTRTRTVLPPLELVDDGHDFELIAKDGLVFYNDLDGSRAGVLSYDGSGWRVGQSLEKFDSGTGEITALDDDTSSAAPPTDAPGPADSHAGADAQTTDPEQPDAATSTSSSPAGSANPDPTTTRIQPPSARPPLPNPGPGPARPVEPDPNNPGPNNPGPNNPGPNNPGPNNPAATVRVALSVSGEGTVTGPNGLSCPGTCSATVTAGTSVSLAAAFPNRSIAIWSGPCAGQTNACTFTPSADTSITLTVAPPPADPVLTVTLNGNGTVTGPVDCPDVSCTATIPSAEEDITLTAAPAARFTGWSGPCAATSTPTCTFRISQDTTVEASFRANAELGDMDTTDADPGIDQRVSFSVPLAQAGDTGVWTWTVSGPTSQGPTEAPAETPFETSFSAAGEYTVHLDVAYADGTSDDAERGITVADQCGIDPLGADSLDFRGRIPEGRETIYLYMSGCYSEAAATATFQTASWLTNTWNALYWYDDNSGSATHSFDFIAGTPPIDGKNEDAIALTLPNGQSRSYDVYGNRPPRYISASTCYIQDDGRARMVIKAADADIATATATLKAGTFTQAMEGYTHFGPPDERYFQVLVLPSELPNPRPSSFTARVTDPYGAYTDFAAGMGNC